MDLIPSKLPLESSVTPLLNHRVLWLDKDSTVYARQLDTPGQLDKSVDWGETWTPVYTFGSTAIERFQRLDDDSILVHTRNGRFSRSTDDGVTFSETFISGNGYTGSWGGLDAYANFVVFAPYAYADYDKVYLSNDYGKEGSWKEILHVKKGVSHPHDVRFDPYENIIWTVWGDHRPSDTILFSDNLGGTWQQSSKEQYYRCTNIMPFPENVWFGTDEFFVTGAYRHVRPKKWTSQTKVKPELYWAAKKNNEDGAPNHWATRPAMVYGNKPMAYWGYKQPTSNPSMPATIFSTDGETVFPVWMQSHLPETESSILAVFGPDNTGNIIADLRSSYTVGEETTDFAMVRVNLGVQN